MLLVVISHFSPSFQEEGDVEAEGGRGGRGLHHFCHGLHYLQQQQDRHHIPHSCSPGCSRCPCCCGRGWRGSRRTGGLGTPAGFHDDAESKWVYPPPPPKLYP